MSLVQITNSGSYFPGSLGDFESHNKVIKHEKKKQKQSSSKNEILLQITELSILHTREWQLIQKQEPAEFKQNSNHVTFHLTVVITQLLFGYISMQTTLPANNQVKIMKVQRCKHPSLPIGIPKIVLKEAAWISLYQKYLVIRFCYG